MFKNHSKSLHGFPDECSDTIRSQCSYHVAVAVVAVAVAEAAVAVVAVAVALWRWGVGGRTRLTCAR